MSEDKSLKFEKGLEQLEKIVEDLESGELTLDDVLKRYEDGIKVARLLQNRLDEATKRIEVLTKDAEGNLKTSPLALESGEKKVTKRKASPEAESDQFLI